MSDPAPNADWPTVEPPHDDAGATGRWRTSLAVPVVIVAIAIGLIGVIVLVARQEQDDASEALAGTSVDTSTLPVTVPYRELAGYIVVDVKLGSSGREFPMILDTGAPTIVSGDVAEVYASERVGTISTTSADGQVVTTDVVTIPRLAIGGAAFADVGAVVGAIEPGNPFFCLTDAGFIGASLMQTGVWQIDPRMRTVTIAASIDELDHVDASLRLDFRRASDVSPSPLLDVGAGDSELTLLLDTGSDGWLVVNPGDLQAVGLSVPADAPAMEVLATTTAGLAGARLEWTAADLAFGAATDQSMPLGVSELLPAGQGNAGNDFLRHFVVTVDWGEDALYLYPLGDDISPSVPLSADVGWADGYVLGSFVAGTTGNEGVELGSAVLAIDGRDVTRAPFDDFCSRLIERPATHELTVYGEVSTTVAVVAEGDFFEPLR